MTATQTITGAAKSVMVNVQSLYCGGTDTFSGSSGGTLRSQVLPSSKYMGLSIQDSTSTGSVAFTSTVTPSTTTWASLGMVLSPAPATGTALARTPTVLSIGGGNTGITNTVMTWTHTIEPTATLLVVAAPWVSGNFISTCTVNGVSMTKAVNWGYNVSGNTAAVDIFYLVNPPAGTQTITVTNVNGGTTWWSGNSVTFSGAVAVGAATTVAQGSASPSGSANDLFLNVIGTWVNNAGGVSGYNQTILWNGDASTGGEPSLIGIARGPSPTFSLTNVMYSYGGYGNVALQIRGPIDRTADASLTVTETQVPSRSTVNAPFVESIGAGGIANAGWSHTVGSRANLLVVGINNAVYGAGPPTVYCDGVAMTQMTTWNYGYVHLGNYSYLTWYYLWNPTPGVHSITTSGAGSNGNSIAIGGAAGLGPPVTSGSGTDTANTLPDQLMLNMFGGWPTGAGQEFTDYSPAAAVLWAPVATGSLPTVIGDWINETGSTTSFSATNHCGYGFGASILPIGNARYANSNLTITASTTATMAVNAVTWESTGAGGSANGGTITWTHTIGATANCVIVGVNTNTNPYNLPTVKVGSSTYLKCLGINYFDSPGANNNYSMIFGLMNPPTGTQTFTVTGQSTFTSANSVAYNNVSGFDTPIYSNGSGTSMTLTDPGVDAGMVVSVFASRGPSVLTNYSQWTRHNFRDANTYPLLIGDAPGGVGLSFSATNSDTSNWGGIGLSLLPQSAAPTGIVYDGMGTSSSLTGYASISFSHVATANAFVILDICADRDNTLTNVQYAGQNMTLQGSVRFPGYSGNAGVWRYTLANVPGGLSTVTATLSANCYFTAQTIGYTGVSSVAAPTTTFGTSSAPSQSVTCNPGQLIVQSIGSASATKIGIPTGGTNLIAANWSGESLVINQATASTTFAGSTSLSNWGAIASVLSRLSFTADSVLAITASPLAVGSLGQFANTTQAITATPTGIGVRNAMVDSTIAITASRTANAIWAIYADAPQQITTTTTSNFLRTAQVDVSQQITVSPSGTGLRNAIVNATQPITFTPSGDLVVGIKANVTESITVTPSGTVSYGATGNVTEQITATLSSAGVRNAMVDSALTVTHSTVQFDNATWGTAYGTYGGCPWTHTAQAGATVFVHAASSQGIYNVQYGGVVMTAGYGGWYLTNVPGGPQTVWINTPPATRVTAIAVSYVGTITYGAVTTGSPQTISCAPGEMIVQISDAGGGTSTGGTTRIQVSDGQYYAYTAADSSTSTTFTLSGGTAYVFVLSPRPSVIAGIGANVTEAITATPSAVTTWQAKANVAQAITASPSALGSRGQSLDSTEQITVSPTTVGSRGQTVDATEQITVSPGGVASRWQGFDSPLVITADLAAYLTQQGYSDADLSITVTHPATVIWDAYTDSYQVVYVYPMGSGYQHSLVFAPLFVTATTDADSTWDTTTGADLLVTTDLPSIGSRGQDIDAPQNITVDLPTVSSLGQAIDADQPIVIGDFDGTIFYGAVGNAPLDITFAPITSDTLLDNHAYAALTVTADRPANVIWDTTADSALIVTSVRHGTFGRLLNVDAVLQVMARVAALARGTFGFDAAQAITVVPTSGVSRGQLLDAAQDITITPAGGIVWHGLIRAPLRITATPLGNAIWDAHANSALTVTESGLIVVSRGQDIDPALDITADTSGEFTQTMDADVEQAILALPDTELSLGSTMDSALSLIVTYSADIGEALRGGNFFYFYL